MKNTSFLLLALALVPVGHAGQTILWSEIGRSVEIIGRLGVPLGTIVTIEATLVPGKDLVPIAHDSRLAHERFLRVDKVQGVPCANRPVMWFDIHEGSIPDIIIVSADGTRRLAEEGESPLKTAAPGTTFTLFAYESGWTPANSRENSPDVGFHFIQEAAQPEVIKTNPYFRTRLNVLDPRSARRMESR